MHSLERNAKNYVPLSEAWADELVRRALRKRTPEWAKAVFEDGSLCSLRTDLIDDALKAFE